MADLFSMGIHVVNLLLLISLLSIYLSNFRHLRSKYTAGLIFFVGIFLIETIMAIHFDTSMVMYYSPAAEFNASILQVIKTVGFAILLWVSWE